MTSKSLHDPILALGFLQSVRAGKEGSTPRVGNTQELTGEIAGTFAWSKQALRLQGWCQAASRCRWRVMQGHFSVPGSSPRCRLRRKQEGPIPALSHWLPRGMQGAEVRVRLSPASNSHTDLSHELHHYKPWLGHGACIFVKYNHHWWSLFSSAASLPLLSRLWSILVSKKRNMERSVPHVHNINSTYHIQEP